ncbi:VWA domain-containing protein [Anaerohalosphaeraceae bacterium U12dextr]
MTEITTTSFYFAQPWGLAALAALVPVLWLARRSLSTLGRVRRFFALSWRILLIVLLAAMLGQLTRVQTNKQVTVVAVLDRSLSIPTELGAAMKDYLDKALKKRPEGSQLAVVDVAEKASISKLAGPSMELRERNTGLRGEQSRLADGIAAAMAIAPPNTAVRILFASDGNETEGDVRSAARFAAMNGIPIDVLPLRYVYDREVVFKNLATPATARSGQTIALRFVLESTAAVAGRLFLSMNDQPVDLDAASAETAVRVELQPGINVKTISMPLGARGLHEFEAVFVPEGQNQDRISQNNRASGLTYVAGPGQVIVMDSDGQAGRALAAVLQNSQIEAHYMPITDLPDSLTRLMGTDAIVLVDTDCSSLSMEQQRMLCRFVTDLGGGLIMVGGPQAFGAGGWIGSPVAEILPVELDPPQKKQMPKGALVLVIDRSGSMAGDKLQMSKIAAAAAVRLLSRQDLVGVVVFDGASHWLVPMTSADDKEAIVGRIGSIESGGGTTMGPAMEDAFEALTEATAAVKHIILLTDGQTSDRDFCIEIGEKIAQSQITISTVAVSEEADGPLLFNIAKGAKGRFYQVVNPGDIPKIFVKEAQVVRRPLIIETSFVPQVTFGLSEILRGLSEPLPGLDGYILTGPKAGLAQTVLSSPEGDPILATCQSGLGRCAALTTSADARWATQWLAWSGYERFWEQLVRWTARPAQPTDCEVITDVSGRQITVYVDASTGKEAAGPVTHLEAMVIGPDMQSRPLILNQVGPGQYRGSYEAGSAGSYLVNLRYQRAGGEDSPVRLMQTPITVPFAPEFKDMKENAALLNEICSITGGRMLPEEPARAELFYAQGLKFPRTETPLLDLLMLIWVGVFLLDVATRRVSVDFAAMARRTLGFFKRSGRAEQADATLAKLKARQKAVHQQLTVHAAKRYEAPEQTPARQVPGTMKMHEEKPIEQPAPAKPQPPAEQPAPAGHIDQLLKAKRKAAGKKEQQ